MESLSQFVSSMTLRGVAIGVGIFLVTFFANLALVSFILVKIPPDYFKESNHSTFLKNQSPVVRVLAIIGKNLLGVVLVFVGILLSLPGVPGQGVLTILLGIMLLDFPGRRRFERWIVGWPKVFNGVNKLRQRFDKPPLVLD
jgi:uncharacterized membrane protein